MSLIWFLVGPWVGRYATACRPKAAVIGGSSSVHGRRRSLTHGAAVCRRDVPARVPMPPPLPERRVLLVDNYDSFTWNLAHDLGRTGAAVEVVRNDRVDLAGVVARRPTHIVLSPGPGRPERAADVGVCRAILAELVHVPVLGVCLGHQALAWQAGARVVHAPRVMHGKTSEIHHHGQGLFAGLPSPVSMMRYHSLVVERASVPASLTVTAQTSDGVVMGLAHRSRPLWGVQFHPESVGSPHGARLLATFLDQPASRTAPRLRAPETRPGPPAAAPPSAPPAPATRRTGRR